MTREKELEHCEMLLSMARPTEQDRQLAYQLALRIRKSARNQGGPLHDEAREARAQEPLSATELEERIQAKTAEYPTLTGKQAAAMVLSDFTHEGPEKRIAELMRFYYGSGSQPGVSKLLDKARGRVAATLSRQQLTEMLQDAKRLLALMADDGTHELQEVNPLSATERRQLEQATQRLMPQLAALARKRAGTRVEFDDAISTALTAVCSSWHTIENDTDLLRVASSAITAISRVAPRETAFNQKKLEQIAGHRKSDEEDDPPMTAEEWADADWMQDR